MDYDGDTKKKKKGFWILFDDEKYIFCLCEIFC